MKLRKLIIGSLIAAIYVTLTLALAPLSYGPIQIRISEALVLLVFYDKRNFIPLLVGCLVANFFSPYGLLDVLFGGFATALALLLMMMTKRLFLASLWPVLTNGFIIAFEIYVLSPPEEQQFVVYFGNAALIGLGEFIAVSVIGCIFFTINMKNQMFREFVKGKY